MSTLTHCLIQFPIDNNIRKLSTTFEHTKKVPEKEYERTQIKIIVVIL